MKRRILAFALTLALTVCCLAGSALAAGGQTHSYYPVYLGDAETDYMADQILAQIPTAGKTDREKIRAVYTWIEKNCKRTEWDGTYWFDESKVAAALETYAAQAQARLDGGTASMRQELETSASEPDENGFYLLGYDSNEYLDSFAKTMLYTRSGNCAHFSALLAVLLSHLGYDCRLIAGEFINNDGSVYEHKWNCVLVDGQYLWLDVRMDEANYARTGQLSYQYFLVSSTSEWARSHKWDDTYSKQLFADAAQIAALTELTAAWSGCSAWAEPYLSQADQLGLIPGSLRGGDMTRSITRAEFAAVAVALYEGLAGKKAPAAGASPFSDTADTAVVQAQALGIVQGVGGGKFAPGATLTREQAATMLGRVCELVKTGAVGTGAALGAAAPSFADAGGIAAYALPYIGFFSQNGVIDGVGGGQFAPKRTMTREQALKIAVTCVTKLA